MTDIDFSKIKPGDFVTVRAKCTRKGPNFFTLVDSDGDRFSVRPEDVVGHEPAFEPLKIGDVVTYDGQELTIMCLHGHRAWLGHSGDVWGLVNVSHLSKVKQP